jgi:hypothetical protein
VSIPYSVPVYRRIRVTPVRLRHEGSKGIEYLRISGRRL